MSESHDNSPPVDLSICTVGQLFEEISKRYDACVLSFVFEELPGQESRQYLFSGGLTVCSGLSQLTNHRLMHRAVNEGDHKSGGIHDMLGDS